MSDTPAPSTSVERLAALAGTDLNDLCDAAEDAIKAGGGFGWLGAPPRHIMEAYWRGVLLVPDRRVFVARLDGTICGSAQLVRPPRNNEAQAFAAQLISNFIAPWARGHGLARRVVVAVEEAARAAGFAVLNLDVRESQDVAIQLYELLGYVRWGTHPAYARVAGKVVAGYYYYKRLVPPGREASA